MAARWIENSTIPPHKLSLVVGAKVVPVRNLSIPLGLCNDTVLEVAGFGGEIIHCRYTSGDYEGQTVEIARFHFTNEQVLEFQRIQFLLRLGYSHSISSAPVP